MAYRLSVGSITPLTVSTVSDVSNGSVIGDERTGLKWQGRTILDVLLNVINENIRIQYESGRLTQEEYGKTYVGLITAAMQQATALVQLQKNLELQFQQANNQAALQEVEKALREAQVDTAKRQIKGFDDNIKIKLLDAQLNAFSTIYASGMLDEVDTGPLNVTNLKNAYNSVASDLNIPKA